MESTDIYTTLLYYHMKPRWGGTFFQISIFGTELVLLFPSNLRGRFLIVIVSPLINVRFVFEGLACSFYEERTFFKFVFLEQNLFCCFLHVEGSN